MSDAINDLLLMSCEGSSLVLCRRGGGDLGRRCCRCRCRCRCVGRGRLRCCSGCAGRLTVVWFGRGLVGRRAVVLDSGFDVPGKQSGLILALGRDLDRDLGLLGALEVVSQVCRVVQALQGPAGVLLVVVVQARSGGGSAMGMGMGMGMWRAGNETVALGSTRRASAGCSHCHSSRRGSPLACSAGPVSMMDFGRAN